MDYAIERRQNTIVHADEASQWGDRYKCPVCGEPVSLRRGRERSAHFAHRPSEGTRECELYHPGGDYQSSSRSSRRPQPLPLYILVDESPRGFSSWRVGLLIPYTPAASGQVVIEAGVAGRTRLDLSRVPQGGKRIPVRSQVEQYDLRLEWATTDSSYTGRFGVPVSGLETDYGNVFRYGERGGRRLDPDQPLYWGRGYYIVWKKGHKLTWPRTLFRRDLRESQDWECACVELPAEEDERTLDWANRFLARGVRRPPVSISLVSPVGLRLLDDSLAIEEGSDALVGIIRERGARMPSELQVSWPGLRSTQVLALATDERLVVQIGRVPKGITTISLSNGEEGEIVLVGRSSIAVREPRPAGLVVRGTLVGTRVLPAHSAVADEAVALSRSGSDNQEAISGVTLPFGLTCTLTYRLPTETEQRFERFDWPEDWPVEQPKLLQAVQEKLWRRFMEVLAQASEVELDFGNFGSITFSSSRLHGGSGQALSLPLSLRERLKWLISFPGSNHDESLPIDWPVALSTLLVSSTERLSAVDRSLLGSVVSREKWPARLAPNLRSIKDALDAVLAP